MNLVICLLMARRFVPRTELRRVIEGYHGLDDSAFARMFERDKAELRDLGVAIETNEETAWTPEEIGYRIVRRDVELAPIEFSAAEIAALGLAAQVWDSATRAGQAVSALAKLRAAGIDPDPGRLTALAPSVGAKESAFAPMWTAMIEQARVTFGYHGRVRRLEPWAMTCRHGAWYVIGEDLDAGESRTYKLVRVEGAVRRGPAGAFQRPNGVDVDALLDKLELSQPDAHAVIAVRDGCAAALRRSATPAVWDDPVPPGFHAYQLAYASHQDVVGELCANGSDVIVLAPHDLRAAVVAQLEAVAR